MTARLSTREAELYGRFLLCLQRDDTDGMVDVLAKLGYLLPNADREALKSLAREVYSELGHLNPLTFKGSRRQADLAAKINSFMRRMQGLTFPRHTLLLSRATGLIEGLCMELVPDRNFIDVVRPRLGKTLTWKTQMAWIREAVSDTIAQWRALPDRVEAMQRRVEQMATRDDGSLVLVSAMVFLVAFLIPEESFWWVALPAGLALLIALRRRFRQNP